MGLQNYSKNSQKCSYATAQKLSFKFQIILLSGWGAVAGCLSFRQTLKDVYYQ